MRAVLQRVSSASVVVNGGDPRTIGPGLMILLGVKDGDDPAIIPVAGSQMRRAAHFADDEGKLNRSAVELGYSVLVVSNFTLYGDTSRGKRPSFIHAAKGRPPKALMMPFAGADERPGTERRSAWRVWGRYAGQPCQRWSG